MYVPQGVNFFYKAYSKFPSLVPIQLPRQWVTGIIFPEVKRRRLQANSSPPFITKVMTVYIYLLPQSVVAAQKGITQASLPIFKIVVRILL